MNKIKYTLAELIADLATSFCRDTSKIVFLDNGYFEIDHDEYKKSYRDDRINKPYEIPESLYKFLSLRVTIENTVEVIDQLEDTMLITVEIDEGEGIFASDADWRQVFWAQDIQRGHRGPRVQTNEDIEAAISKFADFQPQLLLTPEAFGADFVDSIAPVHRFLMQWHSPINPNV